MPTIHLTTHVLSVRLACGVCFEECRIDAAMVDDLNAAAGAWINSHNAPEVVAVEAIQDGVIGEWLAL